MSIQNLPFIVLINEDSSDFICPKCGTGYEVESWNTEYGEPADDIYKITCYECGKEFSVLVTTVVRYYTKI